MSLIVPHWIPSNLWWALPLLATVLGAALRRVLPRTAAARGAPVCLLAGLAGTLIWRGALVAGLASRGRIWSTGLPLLALAGTAAAARQCLLQYDSVHSWQGRGLPGTVTYINGVQPLDTEAFQPLPAGTLLCINQGRNSQRFRIQ